MSTLVSSYQSKLSNSPQTRGIDMIPAEKLQQPVQLELTVYKLLQVLNCVASEIDQGKIERANGIINAGVYSIDELEPLETELAKVLNEATNGALDINPAYKGI